MLFVAVLLICITSIVVAVQSASFRRLYLYVEKELQRSQPGSLPKASVILPCKGLDAGFADNVRKLLHQDYPDFEVIFSVAKDSDPAHEPLRKFVAESGGKAKLVVAGINDKRSQKLNNQLHALEQVRNDSGVLVFVDSDVIARDDFLKHLVAPLADATIGATTGYRFYIASPGNWASILRSLWNRM